MNLTLAIKEMFEGNEVEIYWNEHGDPVMTIQQLAKSLEYADRSGVEKIVQRNDYLDSIDFSVTDKLSAADGKKYDTRIFNEDGIYEITMLSQMPKAKEFRAFVRKMLKSLRKDEIVLVRPQFEQSSIAKEEFEMQLIGARYTSEILRLDSTSNMRMLAAVHEQHGVPTNHLPVYVDEEVTKALSDLLKEHEFGMGAAKANTKLIELGLLEIKERPSSRGGMKDFKSLTEKGLEFGKNLISPRNQKETQPHYYPSRFGKLKDLLEV